MVESFALIVLTGIEILSEISQNLSFQVLEPWYYILSNLDFLLLNYVWEWRLRDVSWFDLG